MTAPTTADGIHSLMPLDQMAPSAQKLRRIYARTPDAPFFQREFSFYTLERWYEQGLSRDADLGKIFGYDAPGSFGLWQTGWCECAFDPMFEVRILEDRGEHELVQDAAGRAVLYFKGRRSGFMPEYVDHPVKDRRTWEENVLWRLDPTTPSRFTAADKEIPAAIAAAKQGLMIQQYIGGPYMLLRSLIGPEALLTMFYDDPDLIHACMRAWLTLADTMTAYHQKFVTLDEIFFGEDICYNHGPLISPNMIREFLFPYYQQLIANIRSRQIDRNRHLYIQIDTDGYAIPVIDVYREIGMDMMSPFEVASGCDVVEVGRRWPDLIIAGGIDKRILATTKDAIDREIDRIFPAMRKRGGYIPTCDHGVPEEVTLDNYLHFRKRCLEFAK